jgi:AraC family transcriptional regulator
MDRDRLLYAGEFLESNLFEPLTAQDIAASAAMSLRSLQRHFTDSVGESLASYVRGRRLTLAARQLVLGHQDILGLALDCQFGSHEAFSRAFRRHYFMSPSEFRQQGCLTHNYHRPLLDEAVLDELNAQRQQPPQLIQVPEHALWGLSAIMHPDQMNGLPLMRLTQRLSADLQTLFGPGQTPRVFIYKPSPGQCHDFCVMVAVKARAGTAPAGLETLILPAGFRATFTLQGDEALLPVFMYHCYAQWIFHSGWHFADAPVELHFPHEREKHFRLTLPVRTTPCSGYRLW